MSTFTVTGKDMRGGETDQNSSTKLDRIAV
jgi:hypothetical protein